jgi:hypothetical protein
MDTALAKDLRSSSQFPGDRLVRTALRIAQHLTRVGVLGALLMFAASCQEPVPSAQAGSGSGRQDAPAPNAPPSITLRASAGPNRPATDLTLQIYVPDPARGFYRGGRYDWSGIVAQATYNGHRYFATPAAQFGAGDAAPAGVVEEFDPTHPQGYDDAPENEAFVKIGVGLLRRVREAAYAPDKPYTLLKTPPWRIIERDDSVEFFQDVVDVRGYAYEYRKLVTLVLDPPSFTIERHLRNTGMKILRTTHVCRPFVRLDDAPIGAGYHVAFNFPPQLAPAAAAALAGRAEIRGNDLWLLSPPPEMLWAELTGYAATSESKEIRVIASATPAQLAILPDYGLSKLQVAATRDYVSPQTSVDIVLKPDDIKFWTTTFQLELRPAAATTAPGPK